MKTIATIPNVPVTALDVYRMLPRGTRAEVIFNTLYMSPSPFFNHQQIVTDLTIIIGASVKNNKNGTLLVSPFDVYLEEHISAIQPDLLFISNKNKGILKDDGYAHGAPDLVIEILSKNETRDKTLKKDLYEKAGVKEYFIVDPKNKLVEAFVLKGKKFHPCYSEKKLFKSSLLKLEFIF
jgi:Uma2 family endonuclease